VASPARRQRSVKDEMRENLTCLLETARRCSPASWDTRDRPAAARQRDTLAPQFHSAGPARAGEEPHPPQLVTLLDEEIPIIAGSEVNDDPSSRSPSTGVSSSPSTRRHTDRVAAARVRFVEKLATPDVTIADIIGDVIRSRRRAAGTCCPTS